MMQRFRQNPEPKTAKPVRAEPLTDAIRDKRKPHLFYAKMGEDELVAYSKKFIAERGIGGRKELEKADLGLYRALCRRKLLDEAGLPEKKRVWRGMEREELVAYSKKFIAERGIRRRKELEKADLGRYNALRKRKLLDEIGLPDSRGERRDWAGMETEELVARAKSFIAENRIGGRGELQKADKGLYQALRKRKLLDAVFSDPESSKHADAVAGVLGALETFGDDG